MGRAAIHCEGSEGVGVAARSCGAGPEGFPGKDSGGRPGKARCLTGQGQGFVRVASGVHPRTVPNNLNILQASPRPPNSFLLKSLNIVS